MSSSPYTPGTGKIIKITEFTEKEKYFLIELPQPLRHRSCQFVMASFAGVGEAPISITSGPRDDRFLELVIRRAGGLTQVFHSLSKGDTIGIRGPYGKGLDHKIFFGKDIIFVCGGLGLAPMRSLIIPVIEESTSFGDITIIIGSKSPAEVLFREDLSLWANDKKVKVINLVDNTQNLPWDGQVGLVTEPISSLSLNPANTAAILCGPPVMYKFVIMELLKKNLSPKQIYVDLERRMKCGIGKCGHCQINHITCCCDGPVFNYGDILNLQEAL